jgi:hypothetical protein
MPEAKVITETKIVRPNIPLQEPPKAVSFPEVDWYVVTKDNMEEFIQRIEQDAGQIVYMAVTPKGYENLAVGMQDLRRYILQQKEIIVYYEKAITEDPEEINSTDAQ